MKSSRATGLVYTGGGVRNSENIEDVRAYYEKILPFYERESIARAHLSFWGGLARRWRPGRILEIGAGLGRITGALARHAPAVGTDISLEMLREASRRLPARSDACFAAADMRGVAFGCRFDLIVAPSDPFSHLLVAAERRRALRAVAEQLSPWGRFVLDGLYRHPRQSKLPERRVRHAGGVLHIREAWFPLGGRDLWHARYRYRDHRAGEPEATLEAAFTARAWDPAEIRALFASCGLAIEKLWGDFDRRPFWRGARRLIIVARRRARFVQRKRQPARGGNHGLARRDHVD